MAYKVLVVDDSSFFQGRLKDIINEHPELEVAGIAANGQQAIEMADKLKPDVISMDYEMPLLDGVSAVRAILAKRQVPIIMFSSLTYEGARITLEALDAGAVDFIPKNFADVSRDSAQLKQKLHDTLLLFARRHGAQVIPTQALRSANTAERASGASTRLVAPAPAAPTPSAQTGKLKNKVKLVVLGASTGGPVALTEVLKKLPANFPAPIVVVQHMPEAFTKALADRLNRQCQVAVAEASDGDSLQPGRVLVAPGGCQLIFERRHCVRILPGDERVNYKPSVDVTFASAAKHFAGSVLGVVLTGMGADGCEGAKLLKQQGSHIWGQDQNSCVVYGMPKAVASAKLTDEVLALDRIGDRLATDV